MIWILFYPESGGRTFVRNLNTYVPDYTASHSKVCYHNLASHIDWFVLCITLLYKPSQHEVWRLYGSEYEEYLLKCDAV
jgi:hypothetical protein